MLIEINILVQSDNRLGEDMLIFVTCHTYSLVTIAVFRFGRNSILDFLHTSMITEEFVKKDVACRCYKMESVWNYFSLFVSSWTRE